LHWERAFPLEADFSTVCAGPTGVPGRSVAGDLVPANVWLLRSAAGDRLALLDHDRTRAGGTPACWRRARRNLVQLNRFVLPGVLATDRARVYRAYAAGRGPGVAPLQRAGHSEKARQYMPLAAIPQAALTRHQHAATYLRASFVSNGAETIDALVL